MGTVASSSERFAYAVLSQVLGVEPRHVDDNSVSAHHDGEMTLSDGTVAAIEVTRLADPRAIEQSRLPDRLLLDEDQTWDLRWGPSVRFKEVEKHCRALIRECNAEGVATPDQLDASQEPSPALAWYQRRDVELRLMSAAKPGAGKVWLMPPTMVSWVDERLTQLGPWLDSQRHENWLASNIDKLAASGRAALHLCVFLHDSAAPAWLIDGAARCVEVETEGPHMLAPLTDLWLVSQYERRVLHWANGRWAVHPYA